MTDNRLTSEESQRFARGDAVWWNSTGNAIHASGRMPAEVVRYSISGKRVYIRYVGTNGIPWHVFVAPERLERREG